MCSTDPRHQELLPHLMRYYKPGLQGVFHSQSEKYYLQTDDFDGTVEIRDAYRDPHENTDRESRLSVRFGFRACKDGQWAIAAFAPDLDKASEGEKRVWAAFRLSEEDLSDLPDPRFKRWVHRYIDGSWGIEDGPVARLDSVIGQINAVAQCAVYVPLFTATDVRTLCFPHAENNHRYHDAHSEAYKFLQDSLSKDAIQRLGNLLNINVKNVSNDRTVAALKQLIPASVHGEIFDPLEVVSAQRRLADHRQRPAATPFPAFETFGRDIAAVVKGLEVLRDTLARLVNMDVASCEGHAAAIKWLPPLDETRSAHPYGIGKALQAVGKQIVRVRAGYREPVTGHHDREALIFEFSDGSLLSIDALTNIRQLLDEETPIIPEDLHVTFDVTVVPALRPFGQPDTSATEEVEIEEE